MPTTFPDSAEGYAALLRDVDRERFGVHFDPVNLIVSPRAYAEHRALIRGFVELLGPHILELPRQGRACSGPIPCRTSTRRSPEAAASTTGCC